MFCWAPYWTFNLLNVYDHVPNSQSTIAIIVFIQSLYPLNSAANPLIFFLFNSALYKRLCAKRSPTAPPTTSVSHLWRHYLMSRLSSVVELQNTLTGFGRVTWLTGWWCLTYIPVISFILCCIMTVKNTYCFCSKWLIIQWYLLRRYIGKHQVSGFNYN